MIDEVWREEAQRAWGPGPDGKVPGYIAEMVAPGKEYDPIAKRYLPEGAAPVRAVRRPWNRLPGERSETWNLPSLSRKEDAIIYYYSGKTASNSPDVTRADLNLALSFFGEDPTLGDREGRSGVVLDLCCGDGIMARRFAQSNRFRLVFGLDVAPQQLSTARKAAEDERTGPDDGLLLLRADAQALPFAEGKVDYVWWGLGMHMVKDPEAALKGIARVLRPGGRLMATLPMETLMPEVVGRMAAAAGFQDLGLRVPRPSVILVQGVRS